MAARSKPKPATLTPNKRALEVAIARARTARSAIDTRYYVAAGELAERLGIAAADIIEELDERAGCREFVNGQSRVDAERDAWADCVERFDKQKAMAV